MDNKQKTIRRGVLVGSATTLIAASVGGAAIYISGKEGLSLKAYQDVGKVWTICYGETHNVKPTDVATLPECNAMRDKRVHSQMTAVAKYMNPNRKITPNILIAHTSFAYNIGLGGYGGSQALKKLNAGDYYGSCQAMLNWWKAGGRDCRKDQGNPFGCYGMWVRRVDEARLCRRGVDEYYGN